MQGGTTNGARAWSIAVLLFFFSAVNFADKLVIGSAAVPLMKEFGLTPTQLGKIGSSFYLLYAISGLVVGLVVVRRASPKWLLVALVAIWTLAQAPVIFGGSVATLFAGRILLGVGEGPATPSGYHALYGWFTSAVSTRRKGPSRSCSSTPAMVHLGLDSAEDRAVTT